uniref:Histone H1 n=1 Tax=Steinernema glaseri TaxID=37863 RepID=A0A1I7XVV2_9BILA
MRLIPVPPVAKEYVSIDIAPCIVLSTLLCSSLRAFWRNLSPKVPPSMSLSRIVVRQCLLSGSGPRNVNGVRFKHKPAKPTSAETADKPSDPPAKKVEETFEPPKQPSEKPPRDAAKKSTVKASPKDKGAKGKKSKAK